MIRGAGLLLALVFAGSAQAAAPTNPCKLATVAQVKAAFGGTVAAGKVDDSTDAFGRETERAESTARPFGSSP